MYNNKKGVELWVSIHHHHHPAKQVLQVFISGYVTGVYARLGIFGSQVQRLSIHSPDCAALDRITSISTITSKVTRNFIFGGEKEKGLLVSVKLPELTCPIKDILVVHTHAERNKTTKKKHVGVFLGFFLAQFSQRASGELLRTALLFVYQFIHRPVLFRSLSSAETLSHLLLMLP